VRATRRDLIKAFAAMPLVRLSGADPDLILYNGLIYTVHPGNPFKNARRMICVAVG
jgi:hypothetical protein